MNKFPEIQEWGDMAITEKERQRITTPKFYNYYKEKFDFCTDATLPDIPRIVEIGVRYGYSAFSFLRARPNATYLGIDMINGGHGGAKNEDTFPIVREMLDRNFPDADITLMHQNTFKLDEIPGEFDFCHVDGNHRRANCLHDLKICFEACSSGGTILIDDYTYIESVKLGVNDFIEEFGPRLKNVDIRESGLRGNVILTKA